MGRDAQASTRLPHDLKREVQEIADKEHRTLSGTIELLLRRGAAAYHRDGRLVPAPNRQLDSAEAAARAMIEEIAQRMVHMIREGGINVLSSSGKKSKRA
jgi:hypothetical protein